MVAMDDLDRRLIGLLRTNAREPVAVLARQLGVTRTTVTSRLDRLLDSGTILGFSARVRAENDPDTIRAIALIEVEGRTTDDVIRQLRGFTEVHSLHTTNGAWIWWPNSAPIHSAISTGCWRASGRSMASSTVRRACC